MSNFYLSDDYNLRWKIGDSNNSLNLLPISECFYTFSVDVQVPSSLSSHGSSGLLEDGTPSIVQSNRYYQPISILGWDLDAQSGIVIPSLYLLRGTGYGARIKYKLHNTIDSTRNINRLTVYLLCALKSVDGGIYYY